MNFDGFRLDGLDFLSGLANNNEKKWFEANRKTWETTLLDPARSFVSTLGDKLHNEIDSELNADPRIGGSIFRINRDTRFSKDKSPYKTFFDMVFVRGGGKAVQAPGFFMRIEPDNITLAIGMYDLGEMIGPYRKAVNNEVSGAALEDIVRKATKIKGTKWMGDSYKRVPRGFDPEHPRADLLKKKGLCAFTSHQVPPAFTTTKFPDWCLTRFKKFAPLYHWMAEL